jgi:putative pyruvate formate lyase activating enzyme
VDPFIPKYIKAKQKGWLQDMVKLFTDLLSACNLCPRQCRVNRLKGEKGYCSTGKKAVVSSFSSHFGEEPQLVGDKGSGTIFFSHCNLKCVFCQNYEISVRGIGQEADDTQIASIMLYLQKQGCHNINLVTPIYVVPQILKALDLAIDLGLKIPLVYNCSGYDSVDTLYLLKDIIDIYMPDFKFWEPEQSELYCNALDYPSIARKAVREMADQVGDLKVDAKGIAYSGTIIRHLVMPDALNETHHILKFLKEKISPHTHVNIMSQYRPMGEACKFKLLSRLVTPEEYKTALHMAKTLDLNIIQ